MTVSKAGVLLRLSPGKRGVATSAQLQPVVTGAARLKPQALGSKSFVSAYFTTHKINMFFETFLTSPYNAFFFRWQLREGRYFAIPQDTLALPFNPGSCHGPPDPQVAVC
jgi:hypothetical protein